MEAVKQKTAEVLKTITKEKFQHCFEQWKKHMALYVEREGEYIEEEKSSIQ